MALVGIGPCKVTPGNRETVNIKPAPGSAGTPRGKSHCLYVTPAGHWCSALSYLLVLQDVKSHLAVNYRGWGEISHSLLTADKRGFLRNFPAGSHAAERRRCEGCEGEGEHNENGAVCLGLGLAVMIAFAFCTQPWGQKEERPLEYQWAPCFCHFATDHTLREKKRCCVVEIYVELVWELSSPQDCPKALVHYGHPATHSPHMPVCQSLLTAHGQSCHIQWLSVSAALAGGLLWCFISGAAAWTVPSPFPEWLWCPPIPVT